MEARMGEGGIRGGGGGRGGLIKCKRGTACGAAQVVCLAVLDAATVNIGSQHCVTVTGV